MRLGTTLLFELPGSVGRSLPRKRIGKLLSMAVERAVFIEQRKSIRTRQMKRTRMIVCKACAM